MEMEIEANGAGIVVSGAGRRKGLGRRSARSHSSLACRSYKSSSSSLPRRPRLGLSCPSGRLP
jgi:hypothetical protein